MRSERFPEAKYTLVDQGMVILQDSCKILAR